MKQFCYIIHLGNDSHFKKKCTPPFTHYHPFIINSSSHSSNTKIKNHHRIAIKPITQQPESSAILGMIPA
jgi:hypothetical protein